MDDRAHLRREEERKQAHFAMRISLAFGVAMLIGKFGSLPDDAFGRHLLRCR